MNFCINPSSPQLIKLAQELGLPANIVAAKAAYWMNSNNRQDLPTKEDLLKTNQVNYVLDAVNLIADGQEVFAKGMKNKWSLNKILTELHVPKEQIKLILDNKEFSDVLVQTGNTEYEDYGFAMIDGKWRSYLGDKIDKTREYTKEKVIEDITAALRSVYKGPEFGEGKELSDEEVTKKMREMFDQLDALMKKLGLDTPINEIEDSKLWRIINENTKGDYEQKYYKEKIDKLIADKVAKANGKAINAVISLVDVIDYLFYGGHYNATERADIERNPELLQTIDREAYETAKEVLDYLGEELVLHPIYHYPLLKGLKLDGKDEKIIREKIAYNISHDTTIYEDTLKDAIDKIDKLDRTNGVPNISEIISFLLANYSYAVQINTTYSNQEPEFDDVERIYSENDGDYIWTLKNSINGNYRGTYKTESEAKAELQDLKSKREHTLSKHYSDITVPGGTNYRENEIATPSIIPYREGHAKFSTRNGIGWFRSDDKALGGITQYHEQVIGEGTENEMWTGRTELMTTGGTPTKTRRILEVQSDLFQKGRSAENLVGLINQKEVDEFKHDAIRYSIEKRNSGMYELMVGRSEGADIYDEYETLAEAEAKMKELQEENLLTEIPPTPILPKDFDRANQFIKLLSKDNNWVTFFVKAIIQDSTNKGYTEVLFPSGDTAIQVEGFGTALTRVSQLEADIATKRELMRQPFEKTVANGTTMMYKSGNSVFEMSILKWNTLIKTFSDKQIYQRLLQDKIDGELKTLEHYKGILEKANPIHRFYETDVHNVLRKQGLASVRVTDEHKSDWFQIKIDRKDSRGISLTKSILRVEGRPSLDIDEQNECK